MSLLWPCDGLFALVCRVPSTRSPLSSSHTFRPLRPSVKHASSASSKRWQARQGRDRFVANAKVQDLKSRAAFKLLEINEKYKIFRKGQTVVDLVRQIPALLWGSTAQIHRDTLLDHGRK